MDPLRIGLVGASRRGWAARAHIPAYAAVPEVRLAAVCTSRADTAAEAARAFGAPRWYDDYRALVRDPGIDAVVVATRIALHGPIVEAALDAGKHVYCEWPLGTSTAEAVALAHRARARGVRVMVGLQARCSPALLRMRALLAEGRIGRVHAFHLGMSTGSTVSRRPASDAFLARQESGYGALSIAGGHCLDLVRWLLGDVEAVAADVSTLVPEWTFADGVAVAATSPDGASLTLRLLGGVVGSAQFTTFGPSGTGFHLDVLGSAGRLSARAPGLPELSAVMLREGLDDARERVVHVPEDRRLGLAATNPAANLARLMRAFAGAVRADADVAPTFADAADLHVLLATIARASEMRTWLDVPARPAAPSPSPAETAAQ